MRLWNWFKSLFAPKPPVTAGDIVGNKTVSQKHYAGNFWGAPWMKFFFDNIWKDEFKYDKFWSGFWKYSGKSYNTVVGSTYAWCMNGVNAALGMFGFKTTMSPMAVSLKKYGQLAGGYWFGAPCHIEHASGGNHVFFFLFWYDKAKNQAACAGFNQSNTSNITIYDFDKEKLTPPRWPSGHPPGVEVSRAEFEKAFPQYAKYTMSGSTR